MQHMLSQFSSKYHWGACYGISVDVNLETDDKHAAVGLDNIISDNTQ